MRRDDAASLRELAEQCRRLAGGVQTPLAAKALTEMADGYAREAAIAAEREVAASAAPLPQPGG